MSNMWHRLNKKEQRMLIVVLVLLVYGIIDLSLNFDRYRAAFEGENTTVTDWGDSLMTNSNGAVAASRELNVVRAWRVDPFYARTAKAPIITPIVSAAENLPMNTPSLPVLTVQAISYSPTNSTAIVNGKIVREGDLLNTFVVTRITENAVILKDATGNLVRVTFSRQGG